MIIVTTKPSIINFNNVIEIALDVRSETKRLNKENFKNGFQDGDTINDSIKSYIDQGYKNIGSDDFEEEHSTGDVVLSKSIYILSAHTNTLKGSKMITILEGDSDYCISQMEKIINAYSSGKKQVLIGE